MKRSRHIRFREVVAALLPVCSGALLIGTAVATRVAADPVPDSAGTVHLCETAQGTLRMVAADAPCPAGRKSLYVRIATTAASTDRCESPHAAQEVAAARRQLAQLEIKVKEMEQAAARGETGNSRVVAPFKVVDRAGRPLFSVEGGEVYVDVKVYNTAGKVVAGVTGKPGGGVVYARSATKALSAALGEVAPMGQGHIGLSIEENEMPRIWLARNVGTQTYQLQFYSSSDKQVAGIGEAIGGGGGVFVADRAGTRKALMGITRDGKGIVWITSGRGEAAVASLTQGASGGGLLNIWSSKGGQPMVEAGVAAGGFGVVRAGPESFKPGYGVLGLPGSYISGKPK